MHLSVKRRIRRFSILLICLPALVACDKTLLSVHDPMHPIGDFTDLKARATGIVDRIELRIQRFVIDPESGEESIDSPVLLVKICDPSGFTIGLICHYRLPFSGDGRMVEFEATVIFADGDSITESYKYASGHFPFDTAPIPIRVSRNPISSLDVIVVPDLGLKGTSAAKPWTEFRWFLDEVIDDHYFRYDAIREWRGLYNFYYSRYEGRYYINSAGQCVFEHPANYAALVPVGDALMFAHTESIRDCSNQHLFSSEFWYGKSIVHESGHSLIGLRDEYPGANFALYGPHACMSNIFQGYESCASEAPSIELPALYCVLIDEPLDIWRIDPDDATGSIMGNAQHRPWSQFGPASLRRIGWRYAKCLGGDCMAPDACDGSLIVFPQNLPIAGTQAGSGNDDVQ